MILPVGSPWPLLLCSRKKSLLLSVTHSFRAFFSRTSSGFSHIIFQQGEEPRGIPLSPRPSRSWCCSWSRSWHSQGGFFWWLCSCQASPARSSASGAARSVLQRRVVASVHADPACAPDSCRLHTSSPCPLPHDRFAAAVHTAQRSSIGTDGSLRASSAVLRFRVEKRNANFA